MTWNHVSANGMAINEDQIIGGIVDFNIDGWFAVPNNDKVDFAEGFISKEAAIDYLSSEGNKK